ncbi:MAG: HAD hydrolase family protein [Bacteroidota bacterium]
MKRNLYVTDLDGTLLRENAILSSFAADQLNALIDQGVSFTVATARSITSVREVLKGLEVKLPIVCSNGAYISDMRTGEHRHVNGLAKPLDQQLLELVLNKGFIPFMGTYDGRQDHLYLGEIANEGMEWYLRDRQEANDRRVKVNANLEDALGEQILSMNIIEQKEPLAELAAAIKAAFGDQFQMYLYENWYSGQWYWLSIYDISATKGHALKILAQELNFGIEELTIFGDNLNDVSMFKLDAYKVAVSNARAEILALSDKIIDTHHTDSVVKYILDKESIS